MTDNNSINASMTLIPEMCGIVHIPENVINREKDNDDTKYEVHLCLGCINNLAEHFPYTIPRDDLKIVMVPITECDNNNLDNYSEVLSKRNKKYLDKHKT